ncbi:uroporphyrinogen-III synthase [Sphingomonas sp. LHG3406-1]|uniref:uroporphyrinogen-III synthase n=1 Tax=Sphingomonas sp. LHG3406-1 TaxID=2804617 RepID=UPI00262726BD|nr:uroporphyrinogen-III synthase [Sphingomonas sp. LHG3406-1]
MRPLVILRPEPGASATAARAAALGLEVRVSPAFATAPVAWTMPESRFGALLLTSANAVRLAGRLPDLPVHAVGEATASAAREAGLTVASVGTGGVEALLETLPADLALLHLAGEERIELASPPQRVTAVTVYRAEPLPLPSPEALAGSVILVHSPAAGRRIASLDDGKDRILIAAISPAAASACGDGWAVCEAAASPSDPALLSLAAKLCEEGNR